MSRRDRRRAYIERVRRNDALNVRRDEILEAFREYEAVISERKANFPAKSTSLIVVHSTSHAAKLSLASFQRTPSTAQEVK